MSDGSDSDGETRATRAEPWVRIQQHTFTNWANDKLQPLELEVTDLRKSFRDGVTLCRLVETLVGHSVGRVKVKAKLNHYESAGNLQLAFDALRSDNVKLVNIGAEDITAGNLKLILGLMWTLIRFYQIGSQSRVPAKSLMLSWCNAVLHPHMRVSNFSADWNDGVALHGIIEYCRPGTCPTWYQMSKSDRVGNCSHGMTIAEELFEIPIVTKAEDFASPNLDELSAMTYLSYFMAEGSPGYQATLNWTRLQVSPTPVGNFDRDWNNGFVLSSLVNSLGGRVPGWPDIEQDWDLAVQNAMVTSQKQLHVEPVLQAADMTSRDVDHLGIMAYAAWHEAMTREGRAPEPEPEPRRAPTPPLVTPPSPPPSSAAAPEIGIMIVDKWRIDAVTTIKVDTTSLGPGNVTASSQAPSGNSHDLVVSRLDENIHHIEFAPTEKGSWNVDIRYNDSPVNGSPFYVNVYDSSLTKIVREYQVATQADIYAFEVDAVQVGIDDVTVYVIHDGATYPHEIVPNGIGNYRVSFYPEDPGTYTVSVYCGGLEVPGSPFDVLAAAGEGVAARGEGLSRGYIGRPAAFDLDTSKLPDKQLEVAVSGPGGRRLPVEITRNASHVMTVTYNPVDSGIHELDVVYHGKPVPGSPFSVDIMKPRVYVLDLPPTAITGQQGSFKIDASEMRKGTLEIDSDLPVLSYDKLGDNTYLVTYRPRRSGRHDIVIRYNNLEVDGCPYVLEVKAARR